MWYKISGDEVEVRVIAKPNSKRSAVTGINQQGLNIALHARPQEGEANKELIAFLSNFFEIPKSKIKLQRGAASRYKVIVMPLGKKFQEFLRLIDNDPAGYSRDQL
ncbi:MAG TPA: DUF167 domain-containing protein [Gammaproteobacteria bacterium]|jgi:uncharacterized protein (TIGR00251 family)|nr:DUF167 domain-containing protein [Gammaproteobacteria bacterium]